MLKLRQEQMDAFQATADEMFVGRIVGHLRADYADSVVRLATGAFEVRHLPDAALRAMVRGGLARARGYGMTAEASLAAFVALMVEVAPNFDEHPLLQRILKDPQVPADSRVERLLNEATEQNWQAAAADYDVNAWRTKP